MRLSFPLLMADVGETVAMMRSSKLEICDSEAEVKVQLVLRQPLLVVSWESSDLRKRKE